MLELPAHRLYILSGPSCTGKSTLIRSLNLSNDTLISSDDIRFQIHGLRESVDEYGKCIHLSESSNSQVFSIMKTMLQARMSQRQTTFIDATNCMDKDRSTWVKIASQYGVESTVLIMQTPLEVALERNKSRTRRLSEVAITRQFESMNYESKFPSIDISEDNLHDINIVHNRIPSEINIDVIGDVHGMYDELVEFIAESDYYIEDNIIKHPDNRKILFLGDIVDRGPKSVEMLRLVAHSVLSGGHYAIRGNHDFKIWKYFDRLHNDAPLLSLSLANAETVSAMMLLKAKERDFLLTYLRTQPFYYTYEGFAFTHADTSYFTPETIMHEDAVYGCSDWGRTNSDETFNNAYEAGLVSHRLVRGHIPSTGETQENVFVIPMQPYNAGLLGMLPMREFITDLDELWDENVSRQEIFKSHLKTFRCTYNYDEVLATRTLSNSFYELTSRKLATCTIDDYGLKLFKYSKQVFWDNLWNEHPSLLKARGIVLDATGKIVQHTFDKVFNYLENDAGKDVDDDKEVIAVEKLNGFFGAITRHPYKNELLVTTTGSFDSPFVDYIKDYLTYPLRGKLMNYLHKNPQTVMFEILHPADPHIIKVDDKEEYGLYLIGARGKNEDDQPLTEAELDNIAFESLDCRRPDWFNMNMGQVKKKLKTCHHEGYMIRDAEDHSFICKFKSPYYLTTKLLGRLSTPNIYKMFNVTDTFKKMVDEEFYPIVDLLIENTTPEELVAMDQQHKMEYVQKLIEEYLA